MVRYLVRFNTPRDDAHTHLKQVGDTYHVGEHRRGTDACAIPRADATHFDTEDAAYAALGRFLQSRRPLGDKDWIAQPHVVEDRPVLLCSTFIGGDHIQLLKDDGAYLVRWGAQCLSYVERFNACNAYGNRIAKALEEIGQ
jgi:hypothetical protein